MPQEKNLSGAGARNPNHMALQKTKTEIRDIEKACRITDEIFAEIIGLFRFTTERELALYIRREIKRRGLREAFPPIVSGGARAGNEIHPKSTSSVLEGFVIIDFGVRVNGYCSDMTRTVFVGKPSAQDKMLYKLVLAAKEKSAKLAKPGSKCAAADAAARATLGAYKKYFIHTLGHGVGKRIHEMPRMYYKRETDTFEEGMAVTIEPGIYIPKKLGIRIEDTYVVEKKGLRALTRSPQKLLVFP
jgi:Xaa-Pro aminopeptidase